MILRMVRTLVVVLLVGLVAIPGLANDQKKKKKNSDIENIGNRNINKGNINFISIEKEIALGRQLAAEVERQVKLVDDPVINEYVNRVAQNLVRNSDAQVPFTVKVIESDEVNAFALPGGFFFVNTGLILEADDEAEMAGAMAHEIAHVTARHGAEQASKAQIINLASIPLIFLGGGIGFATRQAAGFLIPMQFLQFSRSAESEADYLGLQYLYKTGYDPTASYSFFEKIQAKETAKPGTVSKMFRTHPMMSDRIGKVKQEIEDILPPKEQYVVTTSEFQKMKARLVAFENRKPVEGEDKPSLKRRTSSPSVATEADKNDKDAKDPDREPSEDERPKLKRRKP